MCGFLIYLGCDDERQLRCSGAQALSELRHRGPDNFSYQIGDDWFVGHTRLSIIDTSDTANQPFQNRSDRYLLAFNGEIYNYKSLRREMEASGVVFRTSSDTEVLLELILKVGIDAALTKIRGMFSFALFDKREKSVICVRDHFGQKPIHYFYENGTFAAASEVTALLVLLGRRNPDMFAWRTYLCSNGIIAQDRTFFEGIYTLPAGHLLRYRDENLKVDQYFDVTNMYDPGLFRELSCLSVDEAIDGLDQALDLAVERHLVSDVPVGIFLSGGIDSSLLFSYAVEKRPELIAYTKISPGIETIPLDVVPALLRIHPANSRFVLQEKNDYLRRLIRFVDHTATPSRWGGGPPMASMCNIARKEGVKVLLGGDGVDEYCAGYDTHAKMFDGFSGDLYQIHQPLALDSRSPFYEADALAPFEERRFLEREQALSALRDIEDEKERFAKAVLIQDTGAFLQACNLPHGDAYSMMESVELRNPFLDLDLVRYAINLPLSLSFHEHTSGNRSKFIFRELAGRRIGNFVNVPKEGTRNYSMFISDPAFWDLKQFKVAKLFPLTKTLNKKEMFRVLNLEILWRTRFENETDTILDLATEAGRSVLNLA